MTRNRYVWPLSLLFCLFVSPAAVYANMGSPLIWRSLGHLIIGNAVIGLLEGWLLARLFKEKLVRSICIMVLANYLSFLIGQLAVSAAIDPGQPELFAQHYHRYVYPMWQELPSQDPNPFAYNIQPVWLLALLSYLGSIVVEWPFCFWAIRRKGRRPQRALGASIVCQTASYGLIALPHTLRLFFG